MGVWLPVPRTRMEGPSGRRGARVVFTDALRAEDGDDCANLGVVEQIEVWLSTRDIRNSATLKSGLPMFAISKKDSPECYCQIETHRYNAFFYHNPSLASSHHPPLHRCTSHPPQHPPAIDACRQSYLETGTSRSRTAEVDTAPNEPHGGAQEVGRWP